jgi:hypothetical protein
MSAIPAFAMLLLSLSSGGRPTTQYFPEHAFCRPKESGSCERWYTAPLKAMAEPSLFETSRDPSIESYRFLWLRTFHQPVSARLEIAKDGAGELTVKVLSGKGGYGLGHLVKNRTIKISKDSVLHFLGLLEKADFWNSPTEEQTNDIQLDGAQWIMEGVKEGRWWIGGRRAVDHIATLDYSSLTP